MINWYIRFTMRRFILLNFLKKQINLNKFIVILASIFNLSYLGLIILLSIFMYMEEIESLNILFPFIIILFLPLLFFVFSIKTRNAEKIYKFFIGIEVPLFLLCTIRLILIKELTPFYFILIASILLCIIFYGINLSGKEINHKLYKTVSTFIYETTVIISTYFAIISLFFIIPIFYNIILFLIKIDYSGIPNALWKFIVTFDIVHFIKILSVDLFTVSFILFFCCLVFIILFAPIASCVLYIKEFIKKYKEYNNKKNCICFAVLYIALLIVSSFHFSNININNYVSDAKNAVSYNELKTVAKNVLNKKLIIKASILDDYLAELRYINDENDNSILYIYTHTGFSKTISNKIQHLFNLITYPFNYQKEFYYKNSDKDYSALFDEDIQYAEKARISKSVNSTYYTKQIGASLLDINAKDVKVINKEINIADTTTKDIYKVTITEEYINKTNTNKEVYYEFSLPEDAVITGLKLGTKLQHQGILSYKGAARKTYEEETVKGRPTDPALLEKNGLRQYTLRVFPVEPYRNTQANNESSKVQYEYYVKAENGKVALPVIYQVRNAYKGFASKAVITGIINKKYNGEDYITITNTKNTNQNKKTITNKKIAFLLDTSYSNRIQWKDYLKNQIIPTQNNKIDYYFFNEYLSNKMSSLENEKQYNFAGTARYDAYCSLPEKYDAVIMLTDTSVFDNSVYYPCNDNGALYVVHTDKNRTKKIPPYNKTFTNLIYRTNGYVFNDLSYIPDKMMQDSDKQAYISGTPEGKAFNAAMQIDSILRTEDTEDIKTKEKIYSIAQEAGIVSNFTSYIALINKAQEEQLKINEKSTDKFDADLNTGADQGLKEQNNNIFAVPEPEDWLFITVLLLLTVIYVLRNKIKCAFLK